MFFMLNALDEAKKAFDDDETPVGAVVVKDGVIIGRGRNERSSKHLPLAHAEINAISEAAKAIDNWRLDGCALYVTLEPCIMCAGAIMETRVARVVYGARDPKAGAAGSLYDVLNDRRMPHRCNVTGGVLDVECSALLKKFFLAKRVSARSR
ncbi:MAG: tRNA adenosine(34) deaminase TadA [Synergistaceae bacterium]|nr:tRNA adenosine(34) deaminase TadA [Synergistaceae bacterium]